MTQMPGVSGNGLAGPSFISKLYGLFLRYFLLDFSAQRKATTDVAANICLIFFYIFL